MKFKAILLISTILSSFSIGQSANSDTLKSATFNGFKLRCVGPALTSGRVADIAVNPTKPWEYYVAAASGGVWKTTNNGTTFKPVFDGQGSYSIGCISIDPTNSNVVWVGSGENNNQRSVAYGDGLYKSEDGGKSWKNVGLKTSEHIGMISIHPTNSNIVFVAAMGPLWNAGGERGIYKTTDGGKNWERVLHIDEHTGFTEIHMDPRNPDVLYAAAEQRRRHVFTYIGGGPGSGIHKSTDGGKTWTKLSKGLPTVDLGRIGLGISPANPDVVYAIVEASDDKGGFYRSTDRGASWNKMSGKTTSGNYYQEIVCDPKDVDKVFSLDTWLQHTENGGKSFKATGEDAKHVDNHAMWINPANTNHWLVGCDGGVYETHDHGKTWNYKSNLPITQFYKVAVDNSLPFYNIYGGTQDNNSQGGPSRTINIHGISNDDWFITNGGDGFESAVDPDNPNIVYAQSQYGWLVRYDKISGERTGIKPQHKLGDPALRWNWDAPLIISPHNSKRLYFAANKLFRSDDRGNTWEEISGDLTRQLDRNTMKVMDKVWSMDAVEKNKSTTIYGNIVALDESPKQEGLIYVGTDDGLIQITEDNGKTWRKIERFDNVPERTYVNAIICSKHSASTVYAIFNNHKQGDFKPYIFKSTDKGETWKAIQGNLPKRGSVYDVAEDHINKDLLFAGTEFGLFVSLDGGKEWVALKNGLPTIAVRDLEIQERENDLVLGTFGRGFYVLDDYAPMRSFVKEDLKKTAVIYPIKPGLMFEQANPLGNKETPTQGSNLYTTPNPEVGVVFTYLINDSMDSKKSTRQKQEAATTKKGGDVFYPKLDELRAEDREAEPFVLFVIRNEANEVVYKIKQKASKGISRLTWDCRLAPSTPLELKDRDPGRYGSKSVGPWAAAGIYTVQMYKQQDGKMEALTEMVSFEIKALNNTVLPAANRAEMLAFQLKVSELQKAVSTTNKVLHNLNNQIRYIEAAIVKDPSTDLALWNELMWCKNKYQEISLIMFGDGTLSSREFEVVNTVNDRIGVIVWTSWYSTSEITATNKRLYTEAESEFERALVLSKELADKVSSLNQKLDDSNTPYTPGRFPDWKK
ncbi:MAG: photosystem II stability/assembly factor-like uncharacterized protein [Bacteroidia bacterium]|jgi:photosystem II stability/assembly factor-like uncharacterized protein